MQVNCGNKFLCDQSFVQRKVEVLQFAENIAEKYVTGSKTVNASALMKDL